MKKLLFITALMMLGMILMITPALSREIDLGGGKSVNILGSFSNQVQFSTVGNNYDTEEDLQQFLSSLQLMADFKLSSNLSAYISGIATVDWIYDLKHGNNSWKNKGFNKSRDNLYFDDEWWQLLSEAHMTYTPGQFMFRAGKQIVKWGEMESIGVLDQINPSDARRGMGDVEFETYNIAIPMIRAEFWPDLDTQTFSATNFQFLFIPNTPFISNQPESPFDTYLGNDIGGIYSANMMLDLTDLGYGNTRIGSADIDLEEPDDGDSDNFEFAAKLSTQIGGNILSLMAFKGKANSAVYNYDYARSNLNFPLPLSDDSFTEIDTDGAIIVHPLVMGEYPDQEFVGGSLSSELGFLKFSPIGGTAPLLRIESRYELDKAFADENYANEFVNDFLTKYYMADLGYIGWDEVIPDYSLMGKPFVESDYWVNGISFEQKVKIKALQKSYFNFALEYTHSKVLDHDKNWSFEDESETVSFYAETSYFNGKLVPAFWYIKYITDKMELYYPGVYYYWSSDLNFYMGAGIFKGEEADAIDNKDYAVFKINYSF